MMLKDGESMPVTIPSGVRTTLNFNVPMRWVITTTGGTVIECISSTNDPLTITAGGDIKDVTAILMPESVVEVRPIE